MKSQLVDLGYKVRLSPGFRKHIPIDQNTSNLEVIHISGTKGKGSTAAIIESLLRIYFRHLSKPIKVSLYTSPHLRTERERIRINFQPLVENIFAQYFFEVQDTLRDKASDEQDILGYLQLLALLSVHVFKQEKVDMAIYKVYAGGRKDTTNIFDRVVTYGFTIIGLDHIDLLRLTIQDITQHKSGIIKPGTPAFSIIQQRVVREVLESKAIQIGYSLTFLESSTNLPKYPNTGLAAQKINAILAISLANTYLSRYRDELSQEDIEVGIAKYKQPGRFQSIRKGVCRQFLDYVYNTISLSVILDQFESVVCPPTSSQPSERYPRVLIFGYKSTRNTQELIQTIVQYYKDYQFYFDRVILTPYERYSTLIRYYSLLLTNLNIGQKIHDTAVEGHAAFWQSIQGSVRVSYTTSIANALAMAKRASIQTGVETLIYSSTHLVGQALALLEDNGL